MGHTTLSLVVLAATRGAHHREPKGGHGREALLPVSPGACGGFDSGRRLASPPRVTITLGARRGASRSSPLAPSRLGNVHPIDDLVDVPISAVVGEQKALHGVVPYAHPGLALGERPGGEAPVARDVAQERAEGLGHEGPVHLRTDRPPVGRR